MLHSFALSQPLGRSTSVLLKDSLKTKRALNQLGYYDVPAWGMTDFVDAPMLDGVTRFQADNDLRRDGAMKPGGPTGQSRLPPWRRNWARGRASSAGRASFRAGALRRLSCRHRRRRDRPSHWRNPGRHPR